VPLAGPVEERQEHPFADPAATPARVDRERRDVRFVDHDP